MDHGRTFPRFTTGSIPGWMILIGLLFLMVPTGAAAQDSVKAFRSIRFGETPRQVRMKLLQDDLITNAPVSLGDQAVSPEGSRDLIIQDQPYDLTFYFYQNRLYRVQLDGETQGSFGESLTLQRDVLQKVITERYGQASLIRKVGEDDMEAGQFRTSHHWAPKDLAPNKEIWVGFVQSGDSSNFYASLIIQHPPLAQARQEGESLEENSEPPEPSSLSVESAAESF